MIVARDRQRWLTCWFVSILFHAGLLLLGIAWLFHPPSFHVTAGKTSMEIDLIIERAPVSAMPTPALTPVPTPAPVNSVRPVIQSISVPVPVKTEVATKPQLPKPHPQSSPKSSPEKETSSASKGSTEAQPDDLHNDPPDYPEESRAAREQGIVILRVEVTASGEPSSVAILKSSGYFRLDQAARHAVQHWKFHPAFSVGIPVSSEADVPVHFKLE
jgi:periplasmic protein TonB